MKISKSKLIQMIKEEMIKEDDEWVDVSKLKSQAEHGPYAEDEFKKDMETTLSNVVSGDLSFEEAMNEFDTFLDKYKPPEDPWDKHPDPEAFSFDEDELYSGPETPEGRVPGPPEEETIEVTDEEEPLRTTTPTGASHRRMRRHAETGGPISEFIPSKESAIVDVKRFLNIRDRGARDFEAQTFDQYVEWMKKIGLDPQKRTEPYGRKTLEWNREVDGIQLPQRIKLA